MTAHSFNTALKDRILWYDGDITVNEKVLLEYISQGIDTEHIYVDVLTDNITQYNTLLPKDKRVSIKSGLKQTKISLNIPENYKYINVQEYIYKKMLEKYSEHEYIEQYIERIEDEYILFKKHKLINFLRILIYVSEIMEKHDIVHGIGRGSCVASFILYIMGIHRVNSVEYNLDITEFLSR